MSDNPQGPEVLDVNSAASKIEALLSNEGEAEQVESEDTEVEAEEVPEGDEETQPIEDGAEEAEGDGEEEEEGEPEPVSQPKVYTVKVDGQDVQVTEDELKAGYSRTADYTRKTMEVAERRKELDAKEHGLEVERAQYQAVLEVWKQQLDATLSQYPEQDLARLRQTNPAEYAARLAERQEHEKRLQAIVDEQRRLEATNAEQQARSTAEAMRAEAERLMAAVPEWSNPEVAKAERDAIFEYANGFGFTPQELATVTDHRIVLILRDAAKFRALQSKAKAAKPEPKKEAVKAAVPGNAKSKTSSKSADMERLSRRFGQTKHERDAAAILERILPFK